MILTFVRSFLGVGHEGLLKSLPRADGASFQVEESCLRDFGVCEREDVAHFHGAISCGLDFGELHLQELQRVGVLGEGLYTGLPELEGEGCFPYFRQEGVA